MLSCSNWHNLNLIPPPTYLVKLIDMTQDVLICCLFMVETKQKQVQQQVVGNRTEADPAPPANGITQHKRQSKLECISNEEILSYVYHPNTTPPPVCPCNQPNKLDTKLAWTPEELHRITGCCCFWNYNRIIEASQDGKFIDNGEFPITLCSYTTIPIEQRGKTINCHHSWYLNIVHADIAFGNCASIGGFKYALILVAVQHAKLDLWSQITPTWWCICLIYGFWRWIQFIC